MRQIAGSAAQPVTIEVIGRCGSGRWCVPIHYFVGKGLRSTLKGQDPAAAPMSVVFSFDYLLSDTAPVHLVFSVFGRPPGVMIACGLFMLFNRRSSLR